jgi:hypothetical protein
MMQVGHAPTRASNRAEFTGKASTNGNE